MRANEAEETRDVHPDPSADFRLLLRDFLLAMLSGHAELNRKKGEVDVHTLWGEECIDKITARKKRGL